MDDIDDCERRFWNLGRRYLDTNTLIEFEALKQHPGVADDAWKLLAQKSEFEERDLILWTTLLEYAVRHNWKCERDWAIEEIYKFKGSFYPMTLDRFIELFKSEKVDAEWAEIIWKRLPQKKKDEIDSEEVKKIAKSWYSYGEEGGF